MIWTNYHSHCNYCDGHGKMEEYIKYAIKNNILVLGMSSHAPVPFNCFWTMKEEQLENYINELANLKQKYRDQLSVLTSLEIDYVPGITGTEVSLINKYNLDYKIASVHFVDQFEDGEYWAIDGSFEEFKKGVSKIYKDDVQKAIKRFYQLSREMIETQSFDIIGHFDKIKMHNNDGSFFNENEKWYIKEVEDTLNLIADKGIVLEINTKSIERNGLLFPGIDLFPKIKEMDIPVTINSDAHYPEKLLEGFAFVARELKKAGFKYLREYVHGKWIDVPFSMNGIQL